MNKLSKEDKKRIIKLIPQERLNQSDMEFMVERYIYVLKDCDTKINLTKGFENTGGFYEYVMNRQLTLLSDAFIIALGYFSNNIENL